MPPQNAPASVPPSNGTITASPSGRLAIGGHRPSAVAAMPPTAIWPSPPTLVRLARKARMKPRPTSDSATARLIEAPIAKAVPKAPSMNASMASGTSLPLAAISSRPTIIEPTTAMKGTAMPSRRRRSGSESAMRRHATCPDTICPDMRAPMAPRSPMSAGRSPTSRPR